MLIKKERIVNWDWILGREQGLRPRSQR